MSEYRGVKLGSRQAPDPIDHFLEEHFLYRKHTATDASSLFRVVSEQVYDTQGLHHEVRMECVRFMFRKRRFFEPYVCGDFDDYLWQLEKAHTAGTLLELRAMCLMYGRNVIVYEAFKLGKMLTINEEFFRQDALRIFKDMRGHFDTVFVMPEITLAAICQAIAYKLLYAQLFGLPDISLAVETMLYPDTFNLETKFDVDDQQNVVRLLCTNGRNYKLDRPEKTRCLLENFKICAFHNRWCGLNAADSPLPISCVRQILADGGVPFSYTVAKCLDPHTYRNVELYCQNMARFEAKRLNVYMGDYNFKVGARCLVALEPNEPRKLTVCHIQRINWDKTSSYVFSEDKAQFLKVPYAALQPMPPSEFQPWDPPYRHRRQQQLRRPRMIRMKQKHGNYWVPVPNTSKTLHSQGRKVTLPFPTAGPDEVECGNEPNRRRRLPSQPSIAPATRPISQPPWHNVPHDVFYPMPGMGPHQFMPGPFPLQPHMIRSPVRFYLMPPPPSAPGALGPRPVMMPLPFGAHIAPMVPNTFHNFQPLTY